METVKEILVCMILGLVVSFAVSCSSNADEITQTENQANSNAAKTPEISEAERELRSLRTADFEVIFSLKRKDGEAFDSEDKKILKEKTFRANRRTLTKDGKIIFIGTNYKIDKKDIDALKERFEFEDFSKPESNKEKPESNTSPNHYGDNKSNSDSTG